jgi:hypothetical protein
MTMIDQLVSGMPQAPQPVKGSHKNRQQAASGEQETTSASFDDLISKVGQHQTRKDRRRGEDIDLPEKSSVDVSRLPDTVPKVALDLSAELRGLASPTDGRVKFANYKDALKAADLNAKPAANQDALLAKLVDKLKQAAQEAQPAPQARADEKQPDDSVPLTPADELNLLLGLSSAEETDPKHDSKATDKAGKDDESKEVPARESLEARLDPPRADQIQAAAERRQGNAPVVDDAPRVDAVRLVSADGRGRPVDISLPKVADEPQKDIDKPANSAKVDTATVLEARRYLGFTPDTNATALTNAAKADPSWSAALEAVQRADLAGLADTVKEVNTLKLQMNPENLGNMVASLRLKGEELTVELRVDSVEAYRQLSADHDDIVQALQDQGFSIDKVTVQLNATDRTDTGTDRDMARQGQAQAQREEQAQQREGQGGQPGRNDGRQDGRPHWTIAGETVDNAPADGRADPGRTGNIYL